MKRKLFFMALSLMVALPVCLDAKEKKSDVKKFNLRVSSAECYLVRHDGSHWDGKGHSPELKARTLAAARADQNLAAPLAKLLKDGGAAPDAYYRVRVDGHVITESSVVKNSYAPAWRDESKVVSLKPDSKVEITILNRNGDSKDPMETITLNASQLSGAAKAGQEVLQGARGVSAMTIVVSSK